MIVLQNLVPWAQLLRTRAEFTLKYTCQTSVDNVTLMYVNVIASKKNHNFIFSIQNQFSNKLCSYSSTAIQKPHVENSLQSQPTKI